MSAKNIVITGANRGLGLYMTQQHLQKGDRVFVIVRHSSDALTETAEKHSALTIVNGDVSNEDSIRKAAEEIKSKISSIDILYNNAAIFFQDDRVPITETDLERLKDLFNINSIGPLRVVKHLIPLQKSGSSIINISSEAGSIGQCWRKSEYGYSMSKSALNMACMILHNAYKESGIRVLAIHPGWMRTAMGGNNADCDPADNAKQIIDLAEKAHTLDEDIVFIDFEGKQLPW